MRMNKNNKNNKLIIERILFSSEMTKFLSEAQYLVTLKMRSKRRERITEIPNDWSGCTAV